MKNNKFYPKAVLHGSVNFVSGLGKDENASKNNTVDFKGIVFEDMLLQATSPKFSVSYFGYKGKLQLANFPVSINENWFENPTRE